MDRRLEIGAGRWSRRSDAPTCFCRAAILTERGAIAAILVLLFPTVSAAQFQPASDTLLMEGRVAYTWIEDDANIVLLEGPVRIELEDAVMTADDAVVWLRPQPGVLAQQRAEIFLRGSARVEQQQVERSGDRLFVRATIRELVRVMAEQRIARDMGHTPLYGEALELRAEVHDPRPLEVDPELPPAAPPVAPPPVAPPPLVAPPPRAPVAFQGGFVETFQTADDRVALVLSRGVVLLQRRENDDFLEIQADSAVLFTDLRRLGDVAVREDRRAIEDAIAAAYLEGDVRVVYTPAQPRRAEQRLSAERVYYEFATDRAILTEVVLHTMDPDRRLPIVLRADRIRQLAIGEFQGRRVELSTSAFATPSYSVAASRAYVRQEDTEDPRIGTRTIFRAHNVTFNLYGQPVFYLPVAGGSMTERGMALRSLQIQNNRRFGFGVATEWGLIESLGVLPPADLDISYRADYFSARGPAGGIKASYTGGFITAATRDPWDFSGSFTTYFVRDRGKDLLGRQRPPIDPPELFRGRLLWEHQHFFPGDWQVQLRFGYVSDATFLEQWFPREFYTGLPHEAAAYFKRQRDSEALTLLFTAQPNDLVTISDLLQEQFEIERLPEVGYHRIGDAFGRERLTFFSNNRFARLRFRPTEATLEEQGFAPAAPEPLLPGEPALGWTGVAPGSVYRGDFRQQIDLPLDVGRFRVVPYMVGRHTGYSDSPAGEQQHRLYAGAGLRASTAFWKVEDGFYSQLFDINRVRHVVEPELHVYASAQTVDANELFILDQQIDDIHNITAVQLALRQRWQTKRGGPGRWRNVDFLTFNLSGNFFANQPPAEQLQPLGFRGVFFPSMPEASIPRNSVNADSIWRITDTTAILGDVQYSLEEDLLATAAIGLAVQRDPRVSYFIGTRYIEVLSSNITTFAASYELTRKYNLTLTQSYDFGEGGTVGTGATLLRRFDRFFASLGIFHDATRNESGVVFNLAPEGLGFGVGTGMIPGVFR